MPANSPGKPFAVDPGYGTVYIEGDAIPGKLKPDGVMNSVC